MHVVGSREIKTMAAGMEEGLPQTHRRRCCGRAGGRGGPSGCAPRIWGMELARRPWQGSRPQGRGRWRGTGGKWANKAKVMKALTARRA